MDFDDSGGWSTREEAVSRSSWSTGFSQAGIGATVDDEGEQLASALFEEHEDTLPFFGPDPAQLNGRLAHPELRDDPRFERGLFHALLMLDRALGAYLGRLSSLDADDEQLSRMISAELLAYARSAESELTWSVPLFGIAPVGSTASFGDVHLRSLTALEAGRLLETGTLDRDDPTSPQLHSFGFLKERHLLSGMQRYDKRIGTPGDYFPHRLLLAAQLHGARVSGSGWMLRLPQPSWLHSWRGGAPISMSARADGSPSLPVTDNDLAQWVAMANGFGDQIFEQPTDAHDVALHRFATAPARDADADALVDYVVALEAVLLPGIREELRFRFQVHGACFLRDDLAGRRAVQTELRSVYDLRSRLVHGGGAPTHTRILEATTSAAELARTALSRTVRDGWPSATDFETLLLD